MNELALKKQSLIFSAHSLQTYVDCARRFELSYLDGLVWPAVEREPVLESERFLENGRIFHEMVHQDILGIPIADQALRNDDIARWWSNYKTSQPAILEGETYPEQTLVGEIGNNILVATYDLIVITPSGTAIIFDWKTWRHPERIKDLYKRLQSRVYPYLLAQAASTLVPELQLRPDQIEMRYWFAEKPGLSDTLAYSQAQFEEDQHYLLELVSDVLQTRAGDYLLTGDEKKCKYCPYRSYCDRGDVAGSFEEDVELDDPDMVAELLGDLDDYEAVAFLN